MKKAAILACIFILVLLGLYIKTTPDYGRSHPKPAPVPHKTDQIESRRDAKLQANGYELKITGESFKINEQAAIKAARKYSVDCGESAAVRTEKGRLTNRKFPYIAGSDAVLNNYPVWIITFHDVTLIKHGGLDSSPDIKDTIQADQNIFVDAESGEVLMSMAYSI